MPFAEGWDRWPFRMQRFLSFDWLRKAARGWACAAVDAELRATRRRLAEALSTNERLQAERRDLDRQIREKNQFLGNLSHELRSPLNAIIGFAEILISGSIAPDSPKREQFLQHIETSGRQLLRLINDVLELSKIDTGEYRFSPELLDLGTLIASVLDLLHTRIGRKRLRVNVEVDAQVDPVVADPARLKQALMNYLALAVEEAAEGATLTVRATPQGTGRFRVEVQVPSADAERPHEGRGESLSESAALNVALTRRLVQAQGGEAGHVEAPGVGRTYFLELHRLPPHPPRPAPARAVHHEA